MTPTEEKVVQEVGDVRLKYVAYPRQKKNYEQCCWYFIFLLQ